VAIKPEGWDVNEVLSWNLPLRQELETIVLRCRSNGTSPTDRQYPMIEFAQSVLKVMKLEESGTLSASVELQLAKRCWNKHKFERLQAYMRQT
jgi:hypothetical protein